MFQRIIAVLVVLAAAVPWPTARADEKVRIAVVGDSISKNRQSYGGKGWPYVLGELMGDGYDVRTFSDSGVTCLRVPSRSVWSRYELRRAAEFKPNIVIIMMGTNMGKAGHWVHRRRYAGDYRALIAYCKGLPTRPKIYLCKPIPVHEDNFGISGEVVKNGVTPIIERIAKEDKLPLIDTYTPLADKPDTTSDGIHPTRKGLELTARAVRAALTGKPDPALAPRKDALRLPSIIATRMVLQRDVPAPIWGWAEPGTKVTVKIAGHERTGTADADGRWQVTLPAMKAGGPHTMTLSTDKEDKRPLELTGVNVGEVWLCAGGADVASRVKENAGKNEVWRSGANPRMHLLNMPAGTSDEPRHHVRATWRLWDRYRAWERSAAAYHFGNEIQTQLDVPVGVIIAAKPGAPVSAWMPPAGGAGGGSVYNAMIHPAVGFPIRGAILCRGESDGDRAAAYRDEVKALIGGWRKAWGRGDFAFYHVQLGASSGSRPETAKQAALTALVKTYGRKDLAALASRTEEEAPSAQVEERDEPEGPATSEAEGAPRRVELKVADVLNVKGDGPDGEGNTEDDTWQFWFELAHDRGTYRRLSIATATMPAGQRQKGIPNKVTGPIAERMPNPKDTEGWIFHRDWDGRFEGVWGDKKTGEVLMYPYVEKNSHGAVALTYRAADAGVYKISGKLTDVQVRPAYHKHDGIFWKVEKAEGGGRGEVLGEGGPIGDGHGRPDSAAFKIEKAALRKGELIRLVIHPNEWWGTDMTRIDYLRIERVGDAD